MLCLLDTTCMVPKMLTRLAGPIVQCLMLLAMKLSQKNEAEFVYTVPCSRLKEPLEEVMYDCLNYFMHFVNLGF